MRTNNLRPVVVVVVVVSNDMFETLFWPVFFLELCVYTIFVVVVIQISRTEQFLIDLTDTDNNIDALEDTRDVVDQSTLDPKPFGFSGVFIFSEQVRFDGTCGKSHSCVVSR